MECTTWAVTKDKLKRSSINDKYARLKGTSLFLLVHIYDILKL